MTDVNLQLGTGHSNVESSMLVSALAALAKRDLLLAYRNRGELLNPLVFFLIAVAMIPLGVSPDPQLLSLIAPGIIWVMALLATLLSIDGLFRADFDDGSLEQMVINPHPLYLMVLVKVFIHWLVTGLPLTLLSPILAMWLSLPSEGYFPLFVSLLLGTACLSLVGAIGAGLTVALRKGGLLISLIVMPLYVPVLIIGSGAVTNAIDGFPFVSLMTIMGAFLALSIAFAPLATASALKVSLNG
ncbi:MAG: heme exporter protein CcmB [Cellvibrionaceae bacterium]